MEGSQTAHFWLKEIVKFSTAAFPAQWEGNQTRALLRRYLNRNVCETLRQGLVIAPQDV